ncbi:MAG: helix-turn-helix domain-containing protein [Candidatus Polarisedimenticolia bacterium]
MTPATTRWETTPAAVTLMPRSRPTATESFGDRLLRLRQARGYSQRELGDRVGVSQRMMTYYERQADHPPAYLLPRLAEALRVSVDELMGVRPVKEPAATPRNTRLWRKLRDIEKLAPGDRKAVLKFVDALLVRQRVAGGAR